MRFNFQYIAIIFFLFSACAIQDVELVKINNYKVAQTNDKKIKLTLNIRIDNPNNFKIKVKKSNLNLTVSGSDAGTIKLEDKVIIQKKSESDYDFILYANQEQVSKAIIQAGIGIALTGKVNLTVKGWIKGKVFCIGKKIDIEHKESISIKDLGIGNQ